MPPRAEDIDMARIPHSVRVSPRARRVLLKYRPDRGLEVVLPPGVDPARVPEFLAGRRDWVQKMLARHRRHRQRLELTAFPDRIRLRAAGLSHEVAYVESGRPPRLEINSGQRLLVRHPGGEQGSKAAHDLLRRFCRDRAARLLPPLIEAVSRQCGLACTRIQVRDQRTRWASCSSRGTVSLNWRLVFLPPRLCGYVGIHELCHLEHPDHSARFWNLVTAFEPRARPLDALLARSHVWIPASLC
jgi:predicted metal-dependent hydrolase